MQGIEDCGTYIIKTERVGLPEAEKYQALNALNAPVVRLLDVLESEQGRKIVLEKAAPLSFDPCEQTGFDKVIAWMLEFNAIKSPTYPACNLQYIEHYWAVVSQLFTEANRVGSPCYREGFADLPAASYILAEFKRLVAAEPDRVSHGDPANSNIGLLRGEVVAFDLGLSWINSPFVDLALRTGAQVTSFPAGLPIDALVESYARRLCLNSVDPVRDYSICGAIYGSYFEQSALDEIRSGRPSAAISNWANLTLDRFRAFASNIASEE